jgi:hypothetical protein
MATIPLDLAALLEGIPEGAWVAISEEARIVVSYAADFQTALSLAHERGENDPLVLRVPEQANTLFL